MVIDTRVGTEQRRRVPLRRAEAIVAGILLACFAGIAGANPSVGGGPGTNPVDRPRPGDPLQPLEPLRYAGLFGPESLLAQTGFRSAKGTFAEFDFTPGDAGSAARIRYACVEVDADGQQWFEMVQTPEQGDPSGILVQVSRDGSRVLRMRMWTGGKAPFAMDVDEAKLDRAMAQAGTTENERARRGVFNPAQLDGSATVLIAGEERSLQRYRLQGDADGPGAALQEVWVSPTFPFNGAGVMVTSEGRLQLRSWGSDAESIIPLPE